METWPGESKMGQGDVEGGRGRNVKDHRICSQEDPYWKKIGVISCHTWGSFGGRVRAIGGEECYVGHARGPAHRNGVVTGEASFR